MYRVRLRRPSARIPDRPQLQLAPSPHHQPGLQEGRHAPLQPLARSSRHPFRRAAAAVLLAVACAVAANQINGRAQSAPSALTFFTNYFLTGDYVAAGVGLRGRGTGSPSLATGTINLGGVPESADVVAAFLYWQVVTKSSLGPDSGAIGVTFDGNPVYDNTSANAGAFSKVLDRVGTAPCWSSGGGTGSSGGNVLTFTYRADVRRFLKTDANDRIVANGSHVVRVPDAGSAGNGVPIALGASLVVIYRHPSSSFKAIVLYDGGVTINNSLQTYTLPVMGFYQPRTSAGQITYVVGSGQANKRENVSFNGQPLPPDPLFPLGPFAGSDGPSWDTRSFPVSLTSSPAPDQHGARVTTTIDTTNLSGGDCLTPAMVAFKTDVKDSDRDGLLDLWEDSTTTLEDPNGHPLPNLHAMGASSQVPDLFVEIGAFKNDVATTYGDPNNGGVQKPAHNHMPVAAALSMMGDAYANAGINAHFDVGDPSVYHALGAAYATPVGTGDKYLVTSGFRGGDVIDEMAARAAACPTAAACQFPAYPGTVGWKVGYRFYRDQLVNATLAPPPDANGDDPCDVPGVGQPGNDDGPGGQCERRFDRNRKDMFRYVLGAHFVGLPKSEFPCLDSTGNQVPASPDGSCSGTGQPGSNPPAADNVLFHTPRTVSGIGDFPGGDVMLTLGGFSDASARPVGTAIQQAGTLMHEMGHGYDLGHAGIYTYQSPQVPEEPNCNPNYLSVMNYLFQLRGLFNPTNPGVPQVDFSWQSFATIDESNPATIPSWPGRYFTAWYAPASSSTIGTPASRHCTGTIPAASEPQMVRVDAAGVLSGAIDWDLNPASVTAPQDINFDGTIEGDMSAGRVDWGALRLNQLASRRNVFGMSLNLGRDGMGRGDVLGRDGMGRDGMGRDGMGRDGMGRDGMGRDGMGRDGMGRDGMGRDGMGNDGLGGGDGLGRDGLGHDWANRDVGELDAEVAAAAGHVGTPPSAGYNVTLTPLKTPANQGSAVPVIWKVTTGTGAIVGDLSTVLMLESVFTSPAGPCVASSTGVRAALYKAPNLSTGKSTLRFVSPNFQFNWDTTSTTTTGKGCYTVLIYLADAPTAPRMTTPVQLK